MKKEILLILLATLSLSCSTNAEERNTPEPPPDEPQSQHVIVGYLPTWKMPFTPQWDKITHLCLAFGLVQADGNIDLTYVNQNKDIVKTAHANNVKVLLSIGGGGTSNFSSAILNQDNRARLVDNIVTAISSLGIDGIDLDFEEWQGGFAGATALDLQKRTALETTYRLLRQRLGKEVLITAAVSGTYKPEDGSSWNYHNCYNASMHQYLDLVFLMLYDEAGPWNGSPVGQHSTMATFEKSINYWLNTLLLPKEKLVPGVPFYGYAFSSEHNALDAKSISYRDILSKYPSDNAHSKDAIGLTFYNGIPTITRKAEYVKQHSLKGIMIWEIEQDATENNKSLLNAIYSALSSKN